MVIDTFWYHHRDRLPDRSNPGIRSGDTGVLLSFPLFCQRDKSEPLSPATLMDTAREQLPDSIKINGIRVSSDPKRTYQLILPGKKAACFINPYTGEITGIDDGKGFFMKIMRLHRWLLDEYKSRLVPLPVRSTCLRRFLCSFTFAYPGIDWSNLVVRLVS